MSDDLVQRLRKWASEFEAAFFAEEDTSSLTADLLREAADALEQWMARASEAVRREDVEQERSRKLAEAVRELTNGSPPDSPGESCLLYDLDAALAEYEKPSIANEEKCL